MASQKIQIRRGTKAQLEAVTLDLGEFGWCVDDKELWIGNVGDINTLIGKEIADEGIVFGTDPVGINESIKTITFDKAMSSDNYALSLSLINTLDANPASYIYTITNKTTTGFTIILSSPLDTGNYSIDWVAIQPNIASVGLQGTNYEFYRLNNDHIGNPTEDCGIVIERGDQADARLRWNEQTDVWQIGTDIHMSNILTDDSNIDCGQFIV